MPRSAFRMAIDPSILALDLGSTRFKAGSLATDACLESVVAVNAPPLLGDGLIREGNPLTYVSAATAVLDDVDGAGGWSGRLGLTSQRSSFVVWQKEDGAPVTPLISWQDRRAVDWCEAHASSADEVRRRTGLHLSPHYLGPKMAMLLQDPDLNTRLYRGDLLLGTLDAYLVWRWSGGRSFVTDVTMAARTLLMDLEEGDWHPGLLTMFGLPRAALPTIQPSFGRSHSLAEGQEMVASIADQASGVVASLGINSSSMLVNLGTGGFVLMPVGTFPQYMDGYLCGPFLADGTRTHYALEGTINGAGAAVDRYGSEPVDLLPDPSPEAFCMPDIRGWGAPFWRPEMSLKLSEPAQALPQHEQRRVVLEGVLFRVRQIVEDLVKVDMPSDIVVSGGLANEPFVRAGLAILLPCPIRLLDEPEATLRGAALLAANRLDVRPNLSSPVAAEEDLAYLVPKYTRWAQWVAGFAG